MSILLVCSVKELKDIAKLKSIFRGNSDVPISNWSVKRSGYKTHKIDSEKALETDGSHSILKQLKGETADPVPVVNNCHNISLVTQSHPSGKCLSGDWETHRLNHLMAMPGNAADALTKM